MMDRFESSFSLIGWACNPPDAIRFLDTTAHTVDDAKGRGRYNYGHDSDKKVDELIEAASRSVKQEERLKLMTEAQRITVAKDVAFIPLHAQVNLHAKTKKLIWQPQADNNHIYFEMDLTK